MANLSHPNSPLPPPSSEENGLGNQENCHLDVDELISSLPKEKGFISLSPELILYRNFWCSTKAIRAAISFYRRFVATDSDIILASWPKSGTTWLKALAFSTLRRNEFSPSSSNHPLTSSNPHELVPFFEYTIYGQDGELLDMASFSAPRLFATHVPYDSLPESIRQSNCRVIYICRNALDTVVSSWNFCTNASPESIWRGQCSMEEFVDYYCRGIGAFGPFWDNMLGYWKVSLEKPDKVLFLKFEDMKEDSAGNLKKIAEFMGVPFSEEEERDGMVAEILKLCSLTSLKEMEVNKTGNSAFPQIQNKSFFRKGDVGDWVSHLTPSMVEKLKKTMEEKLSPHGLKFRVK